VAFLAPDVRHKAHSASVMLLIPRIQTKLLQMLLFSRRGHNPLLEKLQRTASILQRNIFF
jgi:hypothetical protein